MAVEGFEKRPDLSILPEDVLQLLIYLFWKIALVYLCDVLDLLLLHHREVELLKVLHEATAFECLK